MGATRQRLAAALGELFPGVVFPAGEIDRIPPATRRAYASGDCCDWFAFGYDVDGHLKLSLNGYGTMAECCAGMTVEKNYLTGVTEVRAKLTNKTQ